MIIITPHVYAQNCHSGIELTSPTSRFTLNGDGTATDNKTGLTWMRCISGRDWDGSTCSYGSNIFPTWDESLAIAENITFAGKSDWRVPNIKELITITEKACWAPSINETVFPNSRSSMYWTSSPAANSGFAAWRVDFLYGETFNLDKWYQTNLLVVRDDQ